MNDPDEMAKNAIKDHAIINNNLHKLRNIKCQNVEMFSHINLSPQWPTRNFKRTLYVIYATVYSFLIHSHFFYPQFCCCSPDCSSILSDSALHFSPTSANPAGHSARVTAPWGGATSPPSWLRLCPSSVRSSPISPRLRSTRRRNHLSSTWTPLDRGSSRLLHDTTA
jgi:hypothetical protein